MAKRSTRHSATEYAPEQSSFLHSDPSWQRQKTKGWRFGVLMCGVSAFLVFAINLSTTVWSIFRHGFGGTEGRQTLYEGNCTTASKMNTGIHLAINALSTILLSSSNYCMQCLSAPTRKELDNAHSKGKWLDIGVMSTRNLRGIATKRVVLWWLLGISSLPLHLFYNSAVFLSIAANDYTPIIVTSGFIDSALSTNFTSSGYNSIDAEALRLKKMNSTGGLDALDNLACIDAYGQEFQTRGSVLLVTESSTPRVYYLSSNRNGEWVCEDSVSCDISPNTANLRSNPSAWQPGINGQYISYCLSEQVPEKCRVQSSLHLATVVIVLNLAKAAIMLSLAFRVKESPLMTIGDTVASYLWQSDPLTENMCLVSKRDMQKSKASWPKESKMFKPQRKRLFLAASKTRWTLCILMYLAILGVVAYLLYLGIFNIEGSGPGTLNTIRRLGVGKVNVLTIIEFMGVPTEGPAALIANVVIANAAQPILSFIYFSYNGLFTSISTALEWETYADQRKGLRVSGTPHGEQRCTYFLQLPYRIALPLMVLSGVLHWIVSQSIFLVSVQSYEYSTETQSWSDASIGSTLSCGYSPLAIILTMSAGVLMILILFITGMIRFRTAMPVAASCSAAIAAACHTARREEEEDSSILKVKWGVTGYGTDGVGHCAFSKWPVTPPQDGLLYRGKI